MSTPSADTCATLLLESVPGLMRSIAGSLRHRHDCSDDAPTMGQLQMLAMLSERPWSLSELAHRHRVTPSSMSRMVDVLVQRAWVTRLASPDDRRKIMLHLTPAGREAHAMILRAAQDAVTELVSRLAETDRARLYDGLSVLRMLIDSPSSSVERYQGDEQ